VTELTTRALFRNTTMLKPKTLSRLAMSLLPRLQPSKPTSRSRVPHTWPRRGSREEARAFGSGRSGGGARRREEERAAERKERERREKGERKEEKGERTSLSDSPARSHNARCKSARSSAAHWPHSRRRLMSTSFNEHQQSTR